MAEKGSVDFDQLPDDEIEEMALEPSEHHLEETNRDDLDTAGPPSDELPRPKRRSQQKKGRQAAARQSRTREPEAESPEAADDESPERTEEADRRREADEREETRLRAEAGEEEPPPEDPEGAEEEAPPDDKAGKPFQYKASGREDTFHGLTEMPDGSIRGSKEAAGNIRNLLAAHVELRRTSTEERRRLTREINQIKTGRSAREAEADQVVKLFDELVQKKTPEELYDWAMNFHEKLPEHRAAVLEAGIKQREEALKARESGPELLPEEQEEQLVTAIGGEVDTTLKRLFDLPEAKFLKPEDRQWLRDRWLKHGNRLLSQEGKDLIFDDGLIVEDFLERIQQRKGSRQLLDADKRNQQLNADQRRNGGAPPPTIRGGRRPQNKGAEEPRSFKRGEKREFKKAFLSGKLDSASEDEE